VNDQRIDWSLATLLRDTQEGTKNKPMPMPNLYLPGARAWLNSWGIDWTAAPIVEVYCRDCKTWFECPPLIVDAHERNYQHNITESRISRLPKIYPSHG
jgi:hypothetical protein